MEKHLRLLVYGAWFVQGHLSISGSRVQSDAVTTFIAAPANLCRVMLRLRDLFSRAKSVAKGESSVVSLSSLDSLSALSDSPFVLGGPLAGASALIWLVKAVSGVVFFIKSLLMSLGGELGPNMPSNLSNLLGATQHTADIILALHLTKGPKLSHHKLGLIGVISTLIALYRDDRERQIQ